MKSEFCIFFSYIQCHPFTKFWLCSKWLKLSICRPPNGLLEAIASALPGVVKTLNCAALFLTSFYMGSYDFGSLFSLPACLLYLFWVLHQCHFQSTNKNIICGSLHPAQKGLLTCTRNFVFKIKISSVSFYSPKFRNVTGPLISKFSNLSKYLKICYNEHTLAAVYRNMIYFRHPYDIMENAIKYPTLCGLCLHQQQIIWHGPDGCSTEARSSQMQKQKLLLVLFHPMWFPSIQELSSA